MQARVVTTSPVLTPKEFARFRKLAYDHFGLDLGIEKRALVAARLGKKLRELELESFEQYYHLVEADASGAEMISLVDMLTTNHTSFFREPRHFEILRTQIFPALCARTANGEPIHIWSAACSSGEEPYSIAMSLLDAEREAALAKVRIRASDISTRMLERARRGVYPADKIDHIPPAMRPRYLLKGHRRAEGSFRFKPEVRAMIGFERLNLMESLPEGYRCAVIFCRNLMIYFDRPTQQDLIERLWTHLEDGGYLFTGCSESLHGITHGFEYAGPATYRKPAPVENPAGQGTARADRGAGSPMRRRP